MPAKAGIQINKKLILKSKNMDSKQNSHESPVTFYKLKRANFFGMTSFNIP